MKINYAFSDIFFLNNLKFENEHHILLRCFDCSKNGRLKSWVQVVQNQMDDENRHEICDFIS